MDTIREMIMEKIAMRQAIAQRLEGTILPSVINELKMKSRNLRYTIKGSGGLKAEVSGLTKDNYPWRHAVDLELKTCSCGQWQISGKPCTHAICFIGSLRQVKLDDYVHEYYSLDRFKATYQFEVNLMVDKTQWPIVDLGFEMLPPKLERVAGRPRVKESRVEVSQGKGDLTSARDVSSLGILKRDVVSLLLNLLLNYHHHLLPNLGKFTLKL
jgi:hypothetical protein